MLAAFGFSLMTFFVRISGDVPTMQKAFFRNAFAAIVAFFPLMKSEEKFRIKKGCFGDIACRCIFGTSGLICNFYAIDRLGIADSNMLNKLSPFFAIILSIFILKETALLAGHNSPVSKAVIRCECNIPFSPKKGRSYPEKRRIARYGKNRRPPSHSCQVLPPQKAVSCHSTSNYIINLYSLDVPYWHT